MQETSNVMLQESYILVYKLVDMKSSCNRIYQSRQDWLKRVFDKNTAM